MRSMVLVAVVLAHSVGTSSVTFAQTARNECAVCHLATTEVGEFAHLLEWDESAHGRERIGCETCHAGDPSRP